MKKMILITGMLLSIGAVSFARGHYDGGGHNGGHYGNDNRTHTYDATREAEMIAMQEINLELRKELAKSKPDWKKVEKLNLEIAKAQATSRTEAAKKNNTNK